MTSQVKSLVGACLRGKRSAWNSFVQQYSGLVYYTIKKTLSLYHVEPRTDIVDDLFQNFLSPSFEMIQKAPPVHKRTR